LRFPDHVAPGCQAYQAAQEPYHLGIVVDDKYAAHVLSQAAEGETDLFSPDRLGQAIDDAQLARRDPPRVKRARDHRYLWKHLADAAGCSPVWRTAGANYDSSLDDALDGESSGRLDSSGRENAIAIEMAAEYMRSVAISVDHQDCAVASFHFGRRRNPVITARIP
jgi:hypothetical protein